MPHPACDVCVHGVEMRGRRFSRLKACVCHCGVPGLAFVYPDQLHLCAVCADGLRHAYVCESYVVLDQSDGAPSLVVLSVCAYGGVVGYFWCFSFLGEFCFLDCDDVRLGAVYEFL